jgi:chemotaxis protein methyltransferase CheR
VSPELFRRFAELTYQVAGIHLKPGKEALVGARVAKRVRELQLSDPAAYLRHLEEQPDGEEMQRFVDVISTHFTSFFREADHFELLRAELAGLLARGRQRVRLWSAACSTGEEPWSMAMTALSVDGAGACDLRLLATDIAVDTLRRAAEGRYPDERVEPVPAALRSRFLSRTGDLWEVSPELRALVTYRRLNLAQPPFPMRGPFDVVFCRNVLIYFDAPTRQRLLTAIEALLAPGGLLCIGHTETLNGIRSGLRLVRPSVFRAPGAAT